MYHDQILGPLKHCLNTMLLNLTLGLPYIRVSPDHGPAKDLVGTKRANCESLSKCINFLQKIN